VPSRRSLSPTAPAGHRYSDGLGSRRSAEQVLKDRMPPLRSYSTPHAHSHPFEPEPIEVIAEPPPFPRSHGRRMSSSRHPQSSPLVDHYESDFEPRRRPTSSHGAHYSSPRSHLGHDYPSRDYRRAQPAI
jgi:hypothetical protein